MEDEAPLLLQSPALGTESESYEPNTLADALACSNR